MHCSEQATAACGRALFEGERATVDHALGRIPTKFVARSRKGVARDQRPWSAHGVAVRLVG